MQNKKILPIILAGGSGSRLWPLSRTKYPKQFLSLIDNQTMLQNTISRLDGIKHLDPLIICNEEHRFLVAEQLRKIGCAPSGIILEPIGRNTAPALAIAALKATEGGDDPLLLVLAADHVIKDLYTFYQAIDKAVSAASKGNLVTFGIVPDTPETGYGYIKRGDAIKGSGFVVEEFVEKPSLDVAQSYIDDGNYYWNSGMFLIQASKYLSELAEFRPGILDSCKLSLSSATKDLDFIRLKKDVFSLCPDDSIDYAVMENTKSAVVMPMAAGWSDVGSWSALWAVNEKTQNGNAIRGDVIAENTSNSYIYAENRLVATVGVNDLVVVETKDAVLIADKNKVQDVKEIVNRLKKENRKEQSQHQEVYRPWGVHDEIASGERYHVKKVTVKPGEKTAVQMHYHRAEHWVVVSGTAKVRNGDKSYVVSENESTYIPVGAEHSFENPGKVPLVLIEVRTGSYLGEDDIIRIDPFGEGY